MRELVDATIGDTEGAERHLVADAHRWAGSDERQMEIERWQNLTGCSELAAAERVDMGRAVEYHEERERQAELERNRDRLEAAAWGAERATINQYARLGVTPPGDPLSVARFHAAAIGDEPSRNPDAPIGSTDRPARFAMTGSGLVSLDGGDRSDARRSFAAADEALIARARAQQDDGYMRTQTALYRVRQDVAARAQAAREREAERAQIERQLAQDVARRNARHGGPQYTGTGWPEQPMICRATTPDGEMFEASR